MCGGGGGGGDGGARRGRHYPFGPNGPRGKNVLNVTRQKTMHHTRVGRAGAIVLPLWLDQTCTDPVNSKHLYNICTTLDQRRRRLADFVQMLCKCFVFTGELYIVILMKICFSNNINIHSLCLSEDILSIFGSDFV